MSSTVFVKVVVGAILLLTIKVLLTRKKKSGPLPPGPSPKAFIGNISDLPPAGAQDWMHWAKHKELYGPISSITAMGQTIVIINDAKIATELLNKRSANYSSRPRLVFASEMVGWEQSLAMQPYSDRFRAYRRAMQPYLGSESAVGQYDSLQEVEARRLLLRVLRDPAQVVQHISTEAGAIILKIAYGYTIEPHKKDFLVHISKLAVDQFSIAGTPGVWLVDIIPALKYIPPWLPGADFKRIAQAWKQNLLDMVDKPYAFVKQRMEKDRFEPSYLSNLFKAAGYPQPGSEEEHVAKWTAGSLFAGGADTTVCATETFLLAMTLEPEVQRKAQEEIDRVLGPTRVPGLADRANLPYVNAVVKEVLRWHPVAPMGLPHTSLEDDMWEGYFIPKGSLIMANIWTLTHNPEIYHDPMTFKPERFLRIDGREPEMDPHSLVFGFGRRICPGRFLADNTLYLSIAQSLAVFNISKAVEDGKEVNVKPEFQAGVISHPVPWKFDITPRSPAHVELILSVEKEHPWEESDALDLESI